MERTPCQPGACNCKPPLSQSAYGRHRGVSHVAVGKAIASGRLVKSIDAERRITNVALADAEWTGNTSYAEAPASVRQKAASFEARRAPAPEGDEEANGFPDTLPPETELTSNEVSRRRTYWQGKQAELKYKTEAGELVPAKDVRLQLEDAFRTCRTKLLTIPSRAKQRLPHLTLGDLDLLDTLVRETLEGLALEAER